MLKSGSAMEVAAVRVFFFYLIIMNIGAFILFGWDKFQALRDRRRVSERDLFTSALLGGSAGAIFGMYYFQHKTRHLKFRLGLPLILALQLAGVYFLLISAPPGGI